MGAATENPPLAPYNSTELTTLDPPLPPATRTRPSGSAALQAAARAVLISAAGVQRLTARPEYWAFRRCRNAAIGSTKQARKYFE
jgi:hypothetical protein